MAAFYLYSMAGIEEGMDGSGKMLLVSQAYLIVLAAVLAMAPRYYLIVFFVYFAIIMLVSAYWGRRRVKGSRVSREEIESARQLFVERNAFDVAAMDDELMHIYGKQLKGLLLSFLLLPVYWAIFEAARRLQPSFEEFMAGYGLGGKGAGFLLWLITFEVMFLLSFVVRKFTVGSFFSMSPSQQPPMVPASYIVTDKGIIIKGAMGSVIGFPLPEGTKVRVDEKRGFVEIVFRSGGKIRLYSKRARRLYELIVRFGKPSEVEEPTLKQKREG
jgi:uncharacterized membrane protein